MAGRRGNGEGSIGFYRGRWVARVSLPDGKRKAIYGKSRAEVARKLAGAIRDRDAGLPEADDRITVAQYLNRWLEDSVKPRNRPATYCFYEGMVRLHLVPSLGRIRLTRLAPEHVDRLLAEKLKSGLSPSTVVRIRATLRRALSRAEKHGLVQRNVAALADPPSVKRKHVHPMTADHARVFLEAIMGHLFEALFVTALGTGLRQGEILGLRWSDVDLQARSLTVRHALQRVDGQLKLVEPKTERSRRSIRLSPTVVEQLAAHRTRQQVERVSAQDRWQNNDLVFTTSVGTGLEGGRVTKSFQQVLSQAGLPRMRFHDLRHACASFLIAEGASMRVVMEQLGHSGIGLTMDTYAHLMPEAMADAADKMERVLSQDKE